MPTKTKEKEQVEIAGKPGEFILFVPSKPQPQPEQAQVLHFEQAQVQQDTKGGFNVTLVTPMHEVKFSGAVWEKLDRLSARTPDPYVEDDDL